MAKNQQTDTGINSVQKLITLSMLAFMGYLFFSEEQQNKIILPEPTVAIATQIQPVKVKITDTKTGAVQQSDLSAGKIILGKWEIELAPEQQKPEEAATEKKEPEETKPEEAAAKPVLLDTIE